MPKRPSVAQEIRTIRRALMSIATVLGRLTPLLAAPRGTRGALSALPRRKLKLSPERLAALKQQGEYMGYLRGLRPRQRAQVKTLRAEKGLRRAVALAKRLARA